MDRATLLVIALLSLLVVASAGNGNFSTQNSSHPIAEATGQNQDEVRHHNPAPASVQLCAADWEEKPFVFLTRLPCIPARSKPWHKG
ncbi:hypothetical protein OS493_017965 [Desmophyllum pertusum]|uniref:Uncharacterized protein n=1 Tax=Desmophyllum pertusum TaxID=174260 RepID=A0A9W9Z036_9CNID|nr:hypothetical protein OS493_017965 [Desmophyllum pertusum]